MHSDQVTNSTGHEPMVLVVCTANICRSPFAAALLRSELATLAQLQLSVESAGTEARGGDPACKGLWIHSGLAVPERGDHVSRIVTRELLDSADLILALGASHSSSLAVTSPKARAVTFRLAVASRLASLIASPGHALTGATVGLPRIDDLDPLSRVPELPQAARDRFGWLIAEMNAWRGSVSESESDSVIDPHDAEDDQHPPVASEIIELVSDFAGAVKAVVQA